MLLDFVLNYKEGLVEDVKAEGSLGYNDHEVVEFRILCGRSKAIRRTAALDFRRANFDLFKDLLSPWSHGLVLEGKAAQGSWSTQMPLLPSSRSVYPFGKKSGKGHKDLYG